MNRGPFPPGLYSVDEFPCFSFSGRSVSRIAVSLTMVRIGLDTQTSVFKAGTELLKEPIAYHRGGDVIQVGFGHAQKVSHYFIEFQQGVLELARWVSAQHPDLTS